MEVKRILFFCGCIEPGFDGIGDYTTRLAIDCQKKSIDVSIIALSDSFIKTTPLYSNYPFKTLRLPKSNDLNIWKSLVKKFISEFNPDIISLQFMPYSLNKRGMVFSSINFFREITDKIPIHIMFHELWIGEEKGATLKDNLIGWLQKKSIIYFIKKLSQ